MARSQKTRKINFLKKAQKHMKISKFIIPFLIFIISYVNLSAQTDTTTKITRINKQYFKTYITDTKDLLISPTKWNKKQLLGFGLFAGTSYLVYTQDLKIKDFTQNKRTTISDNISKYALEPIGSGLIPIPGIALLGLHGVIFKNNRSINTSLLLAKTYIITGVMVTIPKILINRHRPYHDNPPNPSIFEGPSKHLYRSYPSGHTTSAFAVATIIASEYNDNLLIPITAYSLASLSGLSRISDNKHWASDVLGGAVFGWAMGKFLYKINKKNVFISPYKTRNSTGFALNFTIN